MTYYDIHPDISHGIKGAARIKTQKFLSIVFLCILLILRVSAASGSTIVYVTNTGEKYHSYGCQYLRKSCISISLGSAVASGYTRCSRCNPPVLDSTNGTGNQYVDSGYSGSQKSESNIFDDARDRVNSGTTVADIMQSEEYQRLLSMYNNDKEQIKSLENDIEKYIEQIAGLEEERDTSLNEAKRLKRNGIYAVLVFSTIGIFVGYLFGISGRSKAVNTLNENLSNTNELNKALLNKDQAQHEPRNSSRFSE